MAEKCLSFDGTDDYVNCGTLNQAVYTFEMWVKPTNEISKTLAYEVPLCLDIGYGWSGVIFGAWTSGLADEIVATGAGGDQPRTGWCGEGTISAGNWHYIVFVWNSAESHYDIYIDNDQKTVTSGTSPGHVPLITAQEVWIGARDNEGAAGEFTGLIDEVRLSSVARTAAEISAIWNGGNGVQFEVDANTVALWHMNEGADSTIYDETDNDNDGTITGASWADGYVFSPSVTEKVDSDTGSGSELKTLTVTLSKSDSGSGLESLLLDAAYILSEAGQGTGAASIILTGADAGNGAETLTNLISALARIETGSGIETVTFRCFTHGDSGQGTDDLASLMNSVLSDETASGADTATALLSALATTEIGSGIDGLLGRVLSLVDTGSGLDVATLYKALFAADSGTGIEALAILLALTSSSEAGSGADLLRAKIEHTAGGDIKLPSGGQTSIPSRKVGI